MELVGFVAYRRRCERRLRAWVGWPGGGSAERGKAGAPTKDGARWRWSTRRVGERASSVVWSWRGLAGPMALGLGKSGDRRGNVEKTMDKVELQVELEGETSQKSAIKIAPTVVEEQRDSGSDDDNAETEEPYYIATGRERRQIRPPQRFAHAELVVGLPTLDYG
ncbi:uncharacterized protein A4U43_C01F16930 [Asparagus officinalis]|uniref:Uncharacterized protein n=1 Tax=Asparagus officinalis TaxID=4686 RepID=A0A5P1FTN0_ASPOF|nr:uncharacterized protein A4U43_C01F16930 [Asparagus officinalis]